MFLPIDKVCQYCIYLNFLFSGKFAAPLWVPSCNVLVCTQIKLLRVRNFWGLSAEIADVPLDVIFLCPGSCMQFQRVHESTLLTCICSYAQTLKINKERKNWQKRLCILFISTNISTLYEENPQRFLQSKKWSHF